MFKKCNIFLLSLFILAILKAPLLANESLFYKEINLIGGYSDREHWVGKSNDLTNGVGFEDYRKFSNAYGDYLTTDLQVRLAYDSMSNAHNAWGIQIHNAWFLYKMNYAAKLRIGHFDPAFGLEPLLDTHSTILQTLAMKDIGFKKDWGVGLEGSLPKFDYKLALQLGSGMGIRRRDGSFLFTSRIGTPTSQNFQYGISFLYGRVLETEDYKTIPQDKLLSDKAILKKRVGLDSQYLFGPYLFKGEVAYGENDSKKVLGYLGEVDYTIPKYQNWEWELQFQSWINKLGESSSADSTLTIGTTYKLNQNITLRAAFAHDLNMMGQKEENRFLLQFYYFGA
ncbi:MAG: hypothetical protein NTX89_03440 [Candidatus Omnitrophica bacterium]|nr:hypothetical protein [Candidatus Omnitrophota bacterium]